MCIVAAFLYVHCSRFLDIFMRLSLYALMMLVEPTILPLKTTQKPVLFIVRSCGLIWHDSREWLKNSWLVSGPWRCLLWRASSHFQSVLKTIMIHKSFSLQTLMILTAAFSDADFHVLTTQSQVVFSSFNTFSVTFLLCATQYNTEHVW